MGCGGRKVYVEWKGGGVRDVLLRKGRKRAWGMLCVSVFS